MKEVSDGPPRASEGRCRVLEEVTTQWMGAAGHWKECPVVTDFPIRRALEALAGALREECPAAPRPLAPAAGSPLVDLLAHQADPQEECPAAPRPLALLRGRATAASSILCGGRATLQGAIGQ